MLNLISGFVVFSLFAVHGATAGDDKLQEVKAKLEAVRKQIAELQQKEQSLLKELQRAKEAQAKRDDSYVKIKNEAEIRGILRYEDVYYPKPVGAVKSWTIEAQMQTPDGPKNSKWGVSFDEARFLALAKANEGKMVVIAGTVGTISFQQPLVHTTVDGGGLIRLANGIVVESLKAATK